MTNSKAKRVPANFGTKPAAKGATKTKVVKKQPAKSLFVGPIKPVLALVQLPPERAIVKVPNDIVLAHKQAKQAVITAQISELKASIQPATEPQAKKVKIGLNHWQNATKGYGDNWPSECTSGRAIWQACEKLQVSENSVTKLATFEICAQGLTFVNKKGETKQVNPNNVSIEVNSYKKYLASLRLLGNVQAA